MGRGRIGKEKVTAEGRDVLSSVEISLCPVEIFFEIANRKPWRFYRTPQYERMRVCSGAISS
jgi:hypothetical protein